MKRHFLIFMSLVLLLVVPVLAQDASTLPNAVASGDVTQTSAILWTHSTTVGTVTFDYAIDEAFNNIVGTVTTEVTDAAIPVKVAVTDLHPASQYYYRATDAAGNSASGKFVTPAEVGQKVGLRFGVSGDQRGELAPFPSIVNVPERDLAFFLEFGDTIYADVASPDVNKSQATTLDDYRTKHNEVYAERYGMNTQAALRASTSILAVIDDHEVTNDFAGGAPANSDARFGDVGDAKLLNETPLFNNGLQAFQEYNPIADEFYGDTGDPRTANKRKLYRYRTWGSDAAFFLLDERSFRDEELPPITEYTSDALNAYLASAFQPGRTMLGQVQLDELKANLLDAQGAGITWKFIFVPEPIQNLGPVASGDRYEGYAAERTEVLKFIVDNKITNVVFVSADIHGTLINNLNYQDAPGGEQIPTGAFDISTGPIAYDAPFGPTVFELAHSIGFVTDQQIKLYNGLPAAAKELSMKQLINAQVAPFGFDTIGLDGSDIDATKTKGDWIVTSSYGWTEFEIDAATQQLHVIVYGIPYYTKEQLDADPTGITSQTPTVMTEFTVNPK